MLETFTLGPSLLLKSNVGEFRAGAQDKSLLKAFGHSSPKYLQKTLIPILKDTQPQGEVKIASTFVDKCNALVSSLFPTESSSNNYEARALDVDASELNSEANAYPSLFSNLQLSAPQSLSSLPTTASISQVRDYCEWPVLYL